MKKFKFPVIAFLAFLFIYGAAEAQIIVNGHNPKRSLNGGGGNSLTLSYGLVFWSDGKNTPLPGYSYSLGDFHGSNDIFSIEKYNASYAVNFGYEKQMSERMAVRATFSTARLYTGIISRLDLITTDKSTISQLGLYSKYTITKNPDHKLQFQWLLGPELVYAHKNVLVEEYVTDASATPDNYKQDVTVVEGALVTGLGISFRLSDKFSLFSDGAIGIALPGKGLKSSNSGLGLKYTW